MNSGVPNAAIEFLENYSHDVPLRWSADDLLSQQEFVRSQLAGKLWLNWATEQAALRLWQSELVSNSFDRAEAFERIVLAGPIVELLDLPRLLNAAARNLCPGGAVVGIVPCLRDNSPESTLFAKLAAELLWPYSTAEEIAELIRDAGWKLHSDSAQFVRITAFNDAVLKDRLAFKGFRRLFDRLESDGYDPAEIAWGELRFVAEVKE